jgi:hypothetical protein
MDQFKQLKPYPREGRLMKPQVTTLPISIKVFLYLIAVVCASATAILIISATSAATATGSAPALAVALVAGPNTGVMAPGEQRWFQLLPGQPGQTAILEQSLTLIFTPDDGQRVRRVSLQIFEEDQLPLFYFGDAGAMANLGAGQIVSRDNNPVTGELFWTGWLSGQKNYYIQLLNSNDTPLDYWLFTADVANYPLGEPTVAAVPMVEPALSVAPALPIAPEIGADAGNPIPLSPTETHGSLKPGTSRWYSFVHNDLANSQQFQDLNFTLFFTPAEGNHQQQVNFKLFPVGAVDLWRRGETDQLINFGAGMLVSRDGDDQTGERFWSGNVIRGDTYLLAIENGTEVEIDYWLFEANIEHPQLNP